ncbi:MAG: trans-aconitate 2-methyltransferase [Alphaproteobacteria bacterium]|jgi:trans-aconitate 2-methyltransferase|nr:trans-aconitate 2-methyltransferase [Alphaproteobacteria bacterium]
MQWDPAQYLAFGDLRLRPAVDLLARLPEAAPGRVADLGCGAGNVTGLLAARWPQAQITGVDSSPDMLAKAKAAVPGADFVESDIAGWLPEAAPEVIFTNAALQWLDDHESLFPSLVGRLAPGGRIAIQMPRNHGEPSHQAMLETVEDGPWTERLRPVSRAQPVATPERYYEILAPQASELDIWETIYLQQLDGENPVKEWTKGTALRPYLAALEGAEREAFEAAYGARILAAYPPAADGRTLFPFRRLFIVARRA